jgi:hypothetical protein
VSGTIVVSKSKSFDVRTIDFVRIVGILRSLLAQSETTKKLLETVDEFGMNMICADELDAAEFADFKRMMTEVRAALGNEEIGLANFLELVCRGINADERLGR